jgi:hypothetical protein
MVIYSEDKLDQIKDALVKFQSNKDTKAAMWMILYYASGRVCSIMATFMLV